MDYHKIYIANIILHLLLQFEVLYNLSPNSVKVVRIILTMKVIWKHPCYFKAVRRKECI